MAPRTAELQKLVVGLGNPGARYADTRHNVGFRVAERFAERCGATLDEDRFESRFASATFPAPDRGAVQVGILLPQTYMNHSGEAVALALEAHPEIRPDTDLIVVFDDMDLPFGRLRLRAQGGGGGHNGLGDILEKVGSRAVPRLRFGVGRPPFGEDPVEYVLANWGADEAKALPSRLVAAAEAVGAALSEGLGEAMSHVNRAEPVDL